LADIKKRNPYTIDPVSILIVAIVGYFAIDVQKNHEAARHANSKPKNVYHRIRELSSEIPNGDNEEISKHGLVFNTVFANSMPFK
jgi:hypothetical protein